MAEIASELANVLDLLDLDATRDVADPVFGAQLPLDLCLFILDSRPSSHYNHLKHILDFESSLLSTPSAVHMDENLDFQPSNFQSHFLPFSLPDDILAKITRLLDSRDALSLCSASSSWYHYMGKGFLALLETDWPVATRSRRILSELATAFGGAVISPVYQWKQVYRYLEGIKEEVDLPTALHEQILAISAFAHFSLISEGIDSSFDMYHADTVSWINVASSAVVESLVKGSGTRLREQQVTKLLQAHSALLSDFLDTFVRDVARTHVVPVFESYLESESSEEALELLILLGEAWLKTKRFVRVLFASCSPMEPVFSLHSSLLGLNLFNLKETLRTSIKQHLWDALKPRAFDVVLKCDSQQLSLHSELLHPLHSFFTMLKEPALAQFMPTPAERSVKQPKFVILKSIDGFRFKVPVKHVRRFDTCALDLERAERLGTCVDADDTLDEELELPDLLMSSDWIPIRDFSEVLDEMDSLDPKEYEDAKLQYVNRHVLGNREPREIAAVILGARELGFQLLKDAIYAALEASRIHDQTERLDESTMV